MVFISFVLIEIVICLDFARKSPIELLLAVGNLLDLLLDNFELLRVFLQQALEFARESTNAYPRYVINF